MVTSSIETTLEESKVKQRDDELLSELFVVPKMQSLLPGHWDVSKPLVF